MTGSNDFYLFEIMSLWMRYLRSWPSLWQSIVALSRVTCVRYVLLCFELWKDQCGWNYGKRLVMVIWISCLLSPGRCLHLLLKSLPCAQLHKCVLFTRLRSCSWDPKLGCQGSVGNVVVKAVKNTQRKKMPPLCVLLFSSAKSAKSIYCFCNYLPFITFVFHF